METPVATLVRILEDRPKADDTLAAYSRRILSSLISRWQNMSVEEIAVSVVLSHITKIDPRT